jgi:hypothetical protein
MIKFAQPGSGKARFRIGDSKFIKLFHSLCISQ